MDWRVCLHFSAISFTHSNFALSAGTALTFQCTLMFPSILTSPISPQNRVLIPGGTAKLEPSNQYTAAGRYIYDIAANMNANNEYMPLFGIARGFELLLYLSAGDSKHREKCLSEKRSLSLNFTDGKSDTTWYIFFNAECWIMNYLPTHFIPFFLLRIRFSRQWNVRLSTGSNYRHSYKRKRHTQFTFILLDQTSECNVHYMCICASTNRFLHDGFLSLFKIRNLRIHHWQNSGKFCRGITTSITSNLFHRSNIKNIPSMAHNTIQKRCYMSGFQNIT